MDAREKLVELMMDMPYGRGTEEEETAHIESVADYLIANGVTVQEWISVKDRLPERFVYVLVMTDFGEAAVARLKGNGRWYIGWDNDQYAGITHWMPLPQPPKGE